MTLRCGASGVEAQVRGGVFFCDRECPLRLRGSVATCKGLSRQKIFLDDVSFCQVSSGNEDCDGNAAAFFPVCSACRHVANVLPGPLSLLALLKPHAEKLGRNHVGMGVLSFCLFSAVFKMQEPQGSARHGHGEAPPVRAGGVAASKPCA